MRFLKGGSQFWLMSGSHALIHLFPSTLAPLLPLIRDEFSLSYTLVGVVGFLPSLGCALAVVPAGLLADRVNRAGIISAALLSAGVAAGIMLTVSGVGQMLLVLLAFSVAVGTFHPAAYSYLSARYSGARGRFCGTDS
jgi:MFS family permease